MDAVDAYDLTLDLVYFETLEIGYKVRPMLAFF